MRLMALLIVLSGWNALSAQDTLRLSLQEADALLQQRSLALVAQRYEVDAATADRVQARLFQNPELSTEWGIFRPGSDRFIDGGRPDSQRIIQVEKLFRIGGQRGLARKAAEQHIRLTEAEYAELAAALRYELHRALYQQYFLHRAAEAISSQLGVLGQITESSGEQLEKGNIPLQEVTRLRTSYFTLNNDRAELLRELNSVQADLAVLLNEVRPIAFTPAANELQPIRDLSLGADELFNRAVEHNPRVQAAAAHQLAADAELKLERREAFPDLSLGGTYDRSDGPWPDYTGLNVGLSIPLFNRNQGRIARARAMAEQGRTLLELERLAVRREVQRVYDNLASLQEQYTATTVGFGQQLDDLSESLIDQYAKSNLKLVEFTDLFESYNAAIIALNRLEAELHSAYDELEYVVGDRVFD